MNSSIRDKFFKRKSCNFPSYWVKTRNCDAFWCVINNKFHTCCSFNSTNISSFSADNSTFHFVSWKCDNRNSHFTCGLCRASLKCLSDNLASFLFAIFSCFIFNLFNKYSSLFLCLIFHFCNKHINRFLFVHFSNFFNFLELLLFETFHFFFRLI